MKAKSILANATVIIICVCVFLTGYARSYEMPVYADSTTDAWTQVTTNQQLVEAFKYYCKSRDLTIEGSIADGVTSFTTKTFNGLCNTLGIDITALQAHLKYQTDNNLGLRFLFDSEGISLYNRIFSQFLQDNELSVGDSANQEDNTVYSGTYITDSQGNGALAFICSGTDTQKVVSNSRILYFGSPYMYSHDTLANSSQNSFYFPAWSNSGANLSMSRSNSGGDWTTSWGQFVGIAVPSGVYANIMYGTNRWGTVFNGYVSFVIYPDAEPSKVYICMYSHLGGSENNHRILSYSCNLQSKQNTTVYLTTNNTTINNNVYEGDTIINNNGTTGDDNDPDPDPDEPNYNPYPGGGGTVTPPGNVGGDGSDGTINFPDLNLNLPEINWSLGDLSNKFPFSIPFDMIAFLTLLNGEPQAPHITGSIPLTSHYTWELDLDFSQFDNFAGIMRGLEFVGFMFFLISATINIVRG